MPVKDVELDCGHRIQISFENFHRLVVAGDVDEQTAPGKARLILDLNSRQIISVPLALKQLEKSLQAASPTYHRRRDQPSLLVVHFQTVPSLFVERRNDLTR